jgi:hypothetical protein
MISLLTPTRKRPERLKKMIESVFDTAANLEGVEIVAYIGEDDNSYAEMDPGTADSLSAASRRFVKFVYGPRVIFSDLWNQAAKHARGDIFMLCADDVFFRTRGWDVVVEAAFAQVPDRILCVYADDMGPSGKSFATLPFVSRQFCDVLGYFTGPPLFEADFSDAWPQDVAEMIGRRRFLPGIEIEHQHWLWGKADRDVVYDENERRKAASNPGKKYAETEHLRKADAAKLKAAIDHFQWEAVKP